MPSITRNGAANPALSEGGGGGGSLFAAAEFKNAVCGLELRAPSI